MVPAYALKTCARGVVQRAAQTPARVPRLAFTGNRASRHASVRAGAKSGGTQTNVSWLSLASNAFPYTAYAAFLGYVFKIAPNQTPLRDTYFIEKLVGLGVNDGVPINPVLFSVFMLLGVVPITLASLMIPSARSGNKVPIWPFLSCSLGLGIIALFPYLCLWQPRVDKDMAPPSTDELQNSWGRFALRTLESRWLPALNLVSAAGLMYWAGSAGPLAWNQYSQFFDESRFVHVSTIDFAMLVAMLPFFMWWDADKREWQGRDVGVPLLALLPVLGPIAYLLLRPNTPRSEGEEEAAAAASGVTAKSR